MTGLCRTSENRVSVWNLEMTMYDFKKSTHGGGVQPSDDRCGEFVPSTKSLQGGEEDVRCGEFVNTAKGLKEPQHGEIDDRSDEFDPSAVDKHKPDSYGTNCLKGLQSGEFLPLTKTALKSDKPFVHPSTGLLPSSEWTEDSVCRLIKDPANEGKAILPHYKDIQGYICPMRPGLEQTYTKDKQFTINSDDYGKGGYGTTQWIIDNNTNIHMIMKNVKKPVFKRKEILALIKLGESGYFPSFHGFISHEETVSIFMDYGGLSFNKVVQDKRFICHLSDEGCFMDIIRQGMEALKYLETKGIIHIDIKPENLCLQLRDGHLVLMVCDLGSCVMGSGVAEKPFISGWPTPIYMTPEMCRLNMSTRPAWKSKWNKEEMVISTSGDVYQLCASLLYLKYFKHWPEVLYQKGWEQNGSHIKDIATDPARLQVLIKPEWDERLKKVFRGAFCGRPRDRITPHQALNTLPTREILQSVSIDETMFINLNALCINDEYPELQVPTDASEDLSASGNLPNLAALNSLATE